MTAPPARYRAGQPSPARLLGLSIAVGLVLLAAACVLANPLSRLPRPGATPGAGHAARRQHTAQPASEPARASGRARGRQTARPAPARSRKPRQGR
jgi:hypothetical protein